MARLIAAIGSRVATSTASFFFFFEEVECPKSLIK